MTFLFINLCNLLNKVAVIGANHSKYLGGMIRLLEIIAVVFVRERVKLSILKNSR